MSTQIKGSILEMTLGKRTGGKIQKTGTKDYIRYKEKEESDAVTLTSKYTDTYWTQLYLKFPNYVYIQVVPDLLFVCASNQRHFMSPLLVAVLLFGGE